MCFMPPKEELIRSNLVIAEKGETHPKMTMEEEYECCENYRDVNQAKMFMAEKRTCELADAFTTLEVQIAVVLFGLVSLFSNIQTKTGVNFLQAQGRGFKFAYISVFILLLVSLAFGLIHIKLRESFWEGHFNTRISRHNKWDEAVKRTATYEQAMAFHYGTANNKTDILSKSPDWTWILQSICLSLAVIIMMVLFVVFLF